MKKFIMLLALMLVPFMVSAEFEPYEQQQRTPKIGTVEVHLTKTVNPNAPPESVGYYVVITDQNDKFMGSRSGNLLPHLTAPQKQQLSAFMGIMWGMANRILPE